LASQGRSIIEQLGDHLGISSLSIAPHLSVQDGIQAVRMTLPKCWFDEDKCRDGIEALRQYEREYSEDSKSFKQNPKHNWCSHGADAFRMLSVSWKSPPSSVVIDPNKPLIVGPGNTATLNDMWESQRRQRRRQRI
jgi:hypothetical protein